MMHPIMRVVLAIGSGVFAYTRVNQAQKKEVSESQLILFNRQSLWGGQPEEVSCPDCGYTSLTNYVGSCLSCHKEFTVPVQIDTRVRPLTEVIGMAIAGLVISLIVLAMLGFAFIMFLLFLSLISGV